MSKLIKLPNGPWIRANQIIQIGEPYNDEGQWCYSVAYNSEIHNNELLFHVVKLHAMIQKEERAYEWIEKLVNKINENS